MYKSFTAQDYRKNIGLPEDYKVDGMLIFGTWDRNKQINNLKNTLNQKGIKYELREMSEFSFLSRIVEIKYENKVLWFDIAYGGALLSEYLHLACLFGSKQNILIGSCGGLSLELDTGTIILPEYSFGDGSTANMYQREISNNL
jgi:purine-nucleoside phosphorylase